MKYCEYCDATYKDDSLEFCSSCGGRLALQSKTEKVTSSINTAVTATKRSYKSGGLARKVSKVAIIIMIASIVFSIIGIILLILLLRWILF